MDFLLALIMISHENLIKLLGIHRRNLSLTIVPFFVCHNFHFLLLYKISDIEIFEVFRNNIRRKARTNVIIAFISQMGRTSFRRSFHNTDNYGKDIHQHKALP